MKMDKSLNLVLPLFTDAGVPYAHVHSAPIGRIVFEKHFRLLSRVFNELFGQGHGVMSGPRVAGLMLRDIAIENENWEGIEGVEATLVAEIHRLSNVIVTNELGKWEMIPLTEAHEKQLISEDDFYEVNNAIVFFIVGSHMFRKKELKPMMTMALGTWSASLTSLNVTEFMNSLPTSTTRVNTGAKAAPITTGQETSVYDSPVGPGSPLIIPS